MIYSGVIEYMIDIALRLVDSDRDSNSYAQKVSALSFLVSLWKTFPHRF